MWYKLKIHAAKYMKITVLQVKLKRFFAVSLECKVSVWWFKSTSVTGQFCIHIVSYTG